MEDIKPGYAGEIQPMQFLTGGEEKRALRSLEEKQSFREVAGAAIDNQWLSSAAERIYDRSTNFDADPDFKVSPESMSEYEQEFDSEGRAYLAKSKSEVEFKQRLSWMREDIERHKILKGYGMKGTAAELVAGVLDPAGWAVGILTGGVGLGAKVTRLGRAIKTGITASAEAAAFEVALMASDTQRSLEDVTFAAAGGLILGSSLGAIFRGKNPEIAKAADDADMALSRGVSETRVKPTFEAETPTFKADEPTYTEVSDVKIRLDSNAINARIDEHVKTLESNLGGSLRGKEKGLLKKSARAVQEQADKIQQQWKSHRARVAASFGAPRNAAEAARNNARYAMIDNLYKPKLKELEDKVLSLQDTIARSDLADKSKKELKTFRDSDRVAQIRQLFPEGAPKLKEEISRQVEAAKKVVAKTKPKVEEDVQPAPEGGDSASAARVAGSVVEREIFTTGEAAEDFITSLIESMEHMPDPITIRYPNQAIGDKIQSSFATLDNSDNLAIRALAHRLLENPQGGFLPLDTADALSHLYGNQIRSAVRNRLNEGYEEFAAARGINPITANLDFNNTKAEFYRNVFLQVYNKSPDADPHVAKAADGLRDGFAKALEIRKNNGEAGFENIVSKDNYIPIIFDGIGMNSVVAKTSKAAVVGAISRGYQTGARKIPKQYADKIAELQYTRTMNTTLSGRQSFERVVSREEEVYFVEGLRAAGIEEEVIEELLGDIEVRVQAESISNRAKLSLGINVNASYGNVKVIDLLNTDVSDLAESYFKEAAGGAALARHGFATERQFNEVVSAAEKYGRNIGLNPGRLQEEVQMLRDIGQMLRGRSIEENPNGGLSTGLRMGRAYTSMIRLQQIGFATIPEAARAISYLGLSTVLKSVPGTAIFRRRAAREGGLSSGELKEPELREIEFLLGYVEEDSWLRPVSIKHEDAVDGGFRNGVVDKLEKALSLGARITNVTSGFQAVQGGLGKITMRSIKKRLVDMASGKAPIDKRLMLEVGWDDTFIDSLMKHIQDKPKSTEFNGKTVQLLNVDDMSPAMREKLGLGLQRMSARLMQKNYIGDKSVWMNKTLGKTLTQFRSFMLVSAEKQLIHDLRGDKVRAAQTLMWSTLLGYLSYTSQVQLQSLGEEDRDSFLRERLDERSLAFGVFNKLPQTAIVSLAGDALASFGLLPEEMYAAPNRLGFRPQTAGTLAPVLGTAADAVKLGNSVVDMMTGETEGKQVAEQARRLIPVANSVGIGQMLKAGIGEL